MIAELFALILAVVAGILSAAIGYQFSRRIGLSEAHARVAVALLFSQVVTLFLALTAILDMPGDDAFLGGASFWLAGLAGTLAALHRFERYRI